MLIRFQTNAFEIAHPVLRKRAVQILGDRVRIVSQTLTVQTGGIHPQLSQHTVDPLHQPGGKFAVANLPPQHFCVGRVQDVVQVGQQGTQGQSHGRHSVQNARRWLVRLLGSERLSTSLVPRDVRFRTGTAEYSYRQNRSSKFFLNFRGTAVHAICVATLPPHPRPTECPVYLALACGMLRRPCSAERRTAPPSTRAIGDPATHTTAARRKLRFGWREPR